MSYKRYVTGKCVNARLDPICSYFGLLYFNNRNKDLLEIAKATDKDDGPKAQSLLGKGANVNAYDGPHKTVLMHAAYHGNKDIVKVLVSWEKLWWTLWRKNKVDVNAKQKNNGETALFKAILGQCCPVR